MRCYGRWVLVRLTNSTRLPHGLRAGFWMLIAVGCSSMPSGYHTGCKRRMGEPVDANTEGLTT